MHQKHPMNPLSLTVMTRTTQLRLDYTTSLNYENCIRGLLQICSELQKILEVLAHWTKSQKTGVKELM